MASNAPPPAQAQSPKPTKASLSYEEISKLFSLPIAEAATILGVCTSVLKRICRSHGIVRWPYRKVSAEYNSNHHLRLEAIAEKGKTLASLLILKEPLHVAVLTVIVSGKVGDDTKNAEREKAKELLELSKVAKQKGFSSSGPSAVTSQGAAKPQQGGAKAGGQVSPPGKQNVSPSLAQANQTKGIPTYMDDFKYGFPSSGLSCETMKWWGTSSHTDSVPVKDGSRESHESTQEALKVMTDDELDWGADEAEGEADGAVTAEPSAQLCSLRRKAVDDGRKLLNGDSRRGQEFGRLSKRQKLVLAQVFGASLPLQWRGMYV
ncbi:hypothetical protein ACP4OV_020900 [Aristida adscensionis]